MEDVHVEGTERIVEAVAKYDVDRYVHVSSHSANPQSPSEFYATKVRSDVIIRSYITLKLILYRDAESKLRAVSSPRLPSFDQLRYLALKTTCC